MTIPPQISAPRRESTGSAGNDSLPELPGIEANIGLRYANGKVANYLKLLRLFRDTHGKTFSTYFRDALEQNNWDEATRHAHSLKSAARTIGAERLGDLAKDLEDACHQHELDPVREPLDRLTLELNIVCSGLAFIPEGGQSERAS